MGLKLSRVPLQWLFALLYKLHMMLLDQSIGPDKYGPRMQSISISAVSSGWVPLTEEKGIPKVNLDDHEKVSQGESVSHSLELEEQSEYNQPEMDHGPIDITDVSSIDADSVGSSKNNQERDKSTASSVHQNNNNLLMEIHVRRLCLNAPNPLRAVAFKVRDSLRGTTDEQLEHLLRCLQEAQIPIEMVEEFIFKMQSRPELDSLVALLREELAKISPTNSNNATVLTECRTLSSQRHSLEELCLLAAYILRNMNHLPAVCDAFTTLAFHFEQQDFIGLIPELEKLQSGLKQRNSYTGSVNFDMRAIWSSIVSMELLLESLEIVDDPVNCECELVLKTLCDQFVELISHLKLQFELLDEVSPYFDARDELDISRKPASRNQSKREDISEVQNHNSPPCERPRNQPQNLGVEVFPMPELPHADPSSEYCDLLRMLQIRDTELQYLLASHSTCFCAKAALDEQQAEEERKALVHILAAQLRMFEHDFRLVPPANLSQMPFRRIHGHLPLESLPPKFLRNAPNAFRPRDSVSHARSSSTGHRQK
ncbi:hypothetical protein Ciccas_006051 [Cichlidogyrus casuarinus]|uniref:Uncharacterized protein n=1 Tax=Cichlidogyrus casuarinus TaxID=1844966 RepID=A0ABD2Q6X9_9PLAT